MDADSPRDPLDPRSAGQLRLLDPAPPPDWRLDDHTRAVGRQGVAAARAALRSARHRNQQHDHAPHSTAA